MADRWNEPLECPQCRQTGLTVLSQSHEAETPTVVCITDGFKAVQTEFGPYFHCRACDIPVDP